MMIVSHMTVWGASFRLKLVNLFISVVVIGFLETDIQIKESTTSQVTAQVVLLEGTSERDFVVGVQTADGSATGTY